MGYGIPKSGIIRFVLCLLRIHVPSGQVWTERSIALCLEQGLMLLHSLTTVYLSHYAPATAHAQLHTTISALDITRTPGPIFCLCCVKAAIHVAIWSHNYDLVSLLSAKWNLPYVTWIRRILSFALLRSSIHYIRATRWSPTLKHPCHLTTYYEAGITSL